MRDEKKTREDDMLNKCFICNLDRYTVNNNSGFLSINLIIV